MLHKGIVRTLSKSRHRLCENRLLLRCQLLPHLYPTRSWSWSASTLHRLTRYATRHRDTWLRTSEKCSARNSGPTLARLTLPLMAGSPNLHPRGRLLAVTLLLLLKHHLRLRLLRLSRA